MDAVRYWRVTGYFTNRSLLQVRRVENLVAASPDGLGRGQMRLITGVFLSADMLWQPELHLKLFLTDHLSTLPFEGVERVVKGRRSRGGPWRGW